MSYQSRFAALAVSAGIFAVLVSPNALAQAKLATKPISPTSISGEEMFRTYCASCHGLDGKGQGPASIALKVPATDLTKMAERNKGPFPGEKVKISLGAMPGSGAHGASDMPVWGDIFRASHQDDAMVQLRLGNLTDYILSIQDPKPVPRAASANTAAAKPERLLATFVPAEDGPAMFKAYCAACHGPDGKGNGPAAASLKARPTDLTMLSHANKGKFPGNRVMNVLGDTPGAEAHGTKEMPVWGNDLRVNQRPEMVRLRLSNITDYLKTIQVK